jgi:PAS domain S-box-containing protein
MPVRLIDSMLDRAPCGFAAFTDDGSMAAVNTTLAQMLGYAREELEGEHLQKILPPGGRIFYNTHVFPLLKMHGVAEEVYIALHSKDGRDIPVLMNAVRREHQGTPPLNESVFVRMMVRHEFEEQLLQARRLAEEAAEAKSRFLSMMSHDLRTPLTTISGYAELLEAGFRGPNNDEQRESTSAIRQAAREMARLMDDILSFAQLHSGRLSVRQEPVPLREAVARAETLVRLRAHQAGLTLQIDSYGNELAALADPDRLQQILLNLITNAIKFTPAGGRITVTWSESADRVWLSVRDTGVGIPRDHLERIFDPFVQLDAATANGARHGVGLGLAISRDLARAMNGDLIADSTLGTGSVFTLDLPAARHTAAVR